MARSRFGVVDTAVALVSIGAASCSTAAEVNPQLITPRAMRPLAAIDERFLSYNVEMAEVIGGNFWRPYTPESIAAMQAHAPSQDGQSGGASANVAGQNQSMFRARPPMTSRTRVCARSRRRSGPPTCEPAARGQIQCIFTIPIRPRQPSPRTAFKAS